MIYIMLWTIPVVLEKKDVTPSAVLPVPVFSGSLTEPIGLP
jgi:hypothetical protein